MVIWDPKDLFGEHWVEAYQAWRQQRGKDKQKGGKKGEDYYQQLLRLDGVVSINAQLLCGQRDGLFELGGQEHADSTQELQMGLRSWDPSQEAVQVIHGQREDLLLALLFLADLQWERERVGVGGNSIRKRQKKKNEKA